MRKISAVVVGIVLCFSSFSVFAEDDYLSKGLAESRRVYKEYVDTAVSEIEVDSKSIDEENISILAVSNYLMMKKKKQPTSIYVMIPLYSSDIYTVYFENEKFVTSEKNLNVFNVQRNLLGNELEGFINKNKLSAPDEIIMLAVFERLHMFAYYVQCNGEKYIIPYYFESDSVFNVTDTAACSLDIGTAYSEDEFIEICENEEAEYEKYREEKERERDKSSVISVDKNGDDNSSDINDKKVNTSEEKPNEQENISDIKPAEQEEISNSNKDANLEKGEISDDSLSVIKKADILKDKELFKGTDIGYELERTLTRSEGTTMLIRLIDKETEVQSSEYIQVLDDVLPSDWFFKYVMYAYNNGIVKGTSETAFTPDREMSATEFTAMLLRSLGYEANPENAFSKAGDIKLLSGDLITALENKAEFTRGDMINIAYAAYEYN